MRGKKHQRRMARAALEGSLLPHHMGVSRSVSNTPPPRAATPPARPGVLCGTGPIFTCIAYQAPVHMHS